VGGPTNRKVTGGDIHTMCTEFCSSDRTHDQFVQHAEHTEFSNRQPGEDSLKLKYNIKKGPNGMDVE